MFINEVTLLRKSYSLEINRQVFFKLIQTELEEQIEFDKELGELGAFDIEYNGHFGNAIYFTIDAENSPKTLQKIKKFIEKSLSRLQNTGNLV